MDNEKINSKIKLLKNSSFVILIFVILKFRNIGRSTFRSSKFWPPHPKKLTSHQETLYIIFRHHLLSLRGKQKSIKSTMWQYITSWSLENRCVKFYTEKWNLRIAAASSLYVWRNITNFSNQPEVSKLLTLDSCHIIFFFALERKSNCDWRLGKTHTHTDTHKISKVTRL